LSYATQFDWNRRMFQEVGIHSKEKTHSARKQSVRHAGLGGADQARRTLEHGRWNTDAMTGVYLSYLPLAFMRSIAGFPQRENTYFLPRAQEIPEEALCTRIWPDTDVWLARMEAYLIVSGRGWREMGEEDLIE
jgi:Centromere DNA-binding protein complex CBF3 subunit, domain 2